MKHKFTKVLLLSIASFVMSSCSNFPFADKLAHLPLIGNMFKPKEIDPEDDDDFSDIPDNVVVVENNVEKVETNIKDRYLLRLGDAPLQLTVKVTAPTPVDEIDADKKLFDWENKNEDIVSLTVDETSLTLKANVTALAVGNATITVKNTHNPDFNFKFEIKVIDIKDSDYIWRFNETQVYYCLTCQKYYRVSDMHKTGNTTYCPLDHAVKSGYKKAETNQFNDCVYVLNAKGDGLIYQEGTKQPGLASGHAFLGEMDWYFERSRADGSSSLGLNTARSDESALTVGKGDVDAENFYLKTTLTKNVKRITIETESARGLADFKIKAGGVEKYSGKANKLYYDYTRGTSNWTDQNEYSVEFDGDFTGDIEFSWVNPAYDQAAFEANPSTYKKPGAIHLKTIIIEYKD